VVGHVAAGEHALHRRAGGARVGKDEVAVGVHLQLALEQLGVGVVTDGDEQALDVELVHLSRDGVAQLQCVDLTVADHALHHRVPAEVDLGVRERALLHDLRRPQLVPPVDDGDVRRELREEDGLLDGGIASPDHRDRLLAEEEPVARRAGRHTVADQPLLGLQTEHARGRAGRHDQRT
jgi:hypothetical protein